MSLVNREAEQNVLGGLLIDNSAWDRVAGKVSESDFRDRGHQLIFRAISIQASQGEQFDPLTTGKRLEDSGDIEKAGGLQYLLDLAEGTIGSGNIHAHAAIVAEAAQRRSLQALYTEAAERAVTDNLEELVGDVTTRMESNAGNKSRVLNFSEAVTLTLGHIDDAAAARQHHGVVGVPTGLPAIDRRTGGLQNGRLYVLAARPSIGKTALANQIAVHAAHRGYAVGVISIEMTTEELTVRAFAHTYDLNFSALSQGHDEEISKLDLAMGKRSITNLPILIDTETSTLGAITGRLGEWKRQHAIDLAIVDHIGLIEGGDTSTRNDHLGKISRTLKLTAKRLGIPILAVSQLNRHVEREKRIPVLADLRDSGNIEQDVDCAIFLHNDPKEPATRYGLPMQIGLLKNRTGRRGWLQERFAFDGATQTFREFETMNNQRS